MPHRLSVTMAAVIGSLLILTACTTGGSLSPSRQVGGPTLSPVCAGAYERYLRERDPRFFAADATGQACGAVVCRHRFCVSSFPGQATRACQQISRGAECFVFAERFTQSWRGPAPQPPPTQREVRLNPGSVPVIQLRRDIIRR